jgi:beta-1,4-mannosyl-glycoprotein beta-1,4-N-acetylglucosaminyltransferase
MFVLLNKKFTQSTRHVQIILVTLFLLIIMYAFHSTTDWYTHPIVDTPQQSQSTKTADFLPIEEAEALCSALNLPVYINRPHRRKVYDLFLINTELDWLEIRLHELHPHVDYFVILEATSSFSGNPKPFHFKSNFGPFQHFYPKIIYHALNLDHIKHYDASGREQYIRNALFDSVFPSLIGPAAPELGDVIIVSDLDEIPRPNTVVALRNCQFPERTHIRSRFYYYSFQWEHIGDEWGNPRATFYQGPNNTIRPEDLRNLPGTKFDLWNAGWHCSSCFSTIAEMTTKIESFSHTDLDRPEFKIPSEVVRRVRNGIDLFDREDNRFKKVEFNDDIPEYLKHNRERFNYLLDRDPPNANFRDYRAP